jgi:hypothetical protein
LTAARPDGWFEEVLRKSKDFDRACQIIGRNTLGLALVAGARIVSLTANAHTENLTTVEYSIGQDPRVKQVALPEFRQTMSRYLLAPLEDCALPDSPDVEALQAHIGGRYLLEAALFHVEPLELRHEDGISEITLQFNELRHVLSLEDFRDVMDERVCSELGIGQADEDVAIDLAIVDQAEEANAHGNWGATVAMLTPWLNPISMLLRTGEADELHEEVRGRLSESLDLLGTAYANLGDLDAANEVLRLGVQWAGDSSKAGDLFMALGRASVASGKHGEAIGLLRRAIRLGVAEREILPLLARSLSARDQQLAAMVCIDRARSAGAEVEDLAELRSELEAGLGDAWPSFRGWMSATE